MDFLSGIWNWFTGSSVASSLAKTALLGYASRLINQNVNQTNATNTTTQPVVDKGVRLQLKADAQNKIPVLYGEAFFGGNLTDARISADYKRMTYCLTLAEVVGNKFSTNGATTYNFIAVYLNNNKVFFKSDGVTVNYTVDAAGNQDNSLSGLVKVYFYKGSTGIQPDGYSGSTPAANTIMTAWGSNFPMTNLLYAIVEVTYNKDKNVTGLPDCQFHVKNDMTLPGDVLVDYMMSTRYGAGISGTEIDGTALAALNTYCNTGFSYQTSGGATQTSIIDINGLVDTNTAVMTNMEEMAKAANSWISYNIHAGLWRVVINQPGTSVATLDDSNIVGEIAVSGTSLTQLNNSVDVKYQNKDIKDKTDYVKINIPSGDLYQNEPGSTLQLSLPFTNSQAVALRVGIQNLKQNRIDKVITFTADYSYINITAGDLISVTSDIYGFSSKLFRVITTEETEGEEGDIQVKFTCLEYSASVYTGDISEYAIETNDGLFTIGAIGKPSTPTIVKTEKANVPRITVTGKAPTGVVEVLEYWITFDVDITNDDDRTYQQFSSFRNKDGSLLTYNQSCVIRYSQLNAGQFYIKTRGANSIISGPFSDPSAKVTYNPVVVADTVSNNPTTDVNGSLMSFGLLALLSLLNDLMNGVTGAGSLFQAISDLFNGQTPGGGTGGGGSGGGTGGCQLGVSIGYPYDRSGESPEYQLTVNGVLYSGNYADHTDVNGPFYFNVTGGTTLSVGSGNIYLYESDGTLSQTISATSLQVEGTKVTIPFDTLTLYTDYYIIADKGLITSANGCTFPAIDSPTFWNFHTDEPVRPPEVITPPTPTVPCVPLKYVELYTNLWTDERSPDNKRVDLESNIGLKFNQSISLGTSGQIKIQSSSGIHQTFDVSQTYKDNKISTELFYVSGDTLWLDPTIDFDRGTHYWVTLDADVVKSACDNTGNEAITGSTISWDTDGGPITTPVINSVSGVINGSSTILNYDRLITRGTGSMKIYDSNGHLVKIITSNDPAVSVKEG